MILNELLGGNSTKDSLPSSICIVITPKDLSETWAFDLGGPSYGQRIGLPYG